MGIFNFLKKKKQENFPATPEPNPINDSNENFLSINSRPVHPDLRNLLWIKDGPRKNFFPRKESQGTFSIFGRDIPFPLHGEEEPSLISTSLPIASGTDASTIERPPYYPSYGGLTPEQRDIYWKLLENPYNPQIDVGYAFVLYYGLERHLFEGDFENACAVILKMRDVFKNKSFQQYSSKAVVLSCLYHKRADYASKFLQSVDKDFEMQIDSNIFTLCKLGLSLPIYPKEIMFLHRKFLFDNNRYIKSNPDLFLKNMSEIISEEYDAPEIDLRSLFEDKVQLSSISSIDIPMFANYTMLNTAITIPDFMSVGSYVGEMYSLLSKAHNRTKLILREKKVHTTHEGGEGALNSFQKCIYRISENEKSGDPVLVPADQKKIAIQNILYLNTFLTQAKKRCPAFPQLQIAEKDINFSRRHKYTNDFCNIEILPNTAKGNPPKYRQCLHFYTSDIDLIANNATCIFGDLFYLPDGDIGKSNIVCWWDGSCFTVGCSLKYGEVQVSAIDVSKNGAKEKLFRL